MRIAISSTGKLLDSDMDPRFGRAAYFIIVDVETMIFEAVQNTPSLTVSRGAGIQAGKNLADHHVDVLITGHCGPKAFEVLRNAGVKIMTGAGGKVADVIAQFKKGELELAAKADVAGHWI